MNTRLLSALLAFSAAALAQEPLPLEHILEENDLNHDGYVTREEADATGKPLARMFDMWDANHDGKITLDEIKAGYEAMRKRMSEGQRPEPKPETASGK